MEENWFMFVRFLQTWVTHQLLDRHYSSMLISSSMTQTKEVKVYQRNVLFFYALLQRQIGSHNSLCRILRGEVKKRFTKCFFFFLVDLQAADTYFTLSPLIL